MYTAHTVGAGLHLEYPAWVIGEAVPMNYTEQLLHKALLQGPGDVVAQPNI